MSDDTQPRSPFPEGQKPLLNMQQPPPRPRQADGPGCLVWGLMSLIVLGMALLVVGMAGAAGWTAGQREADRLETATQAVNIQEQLARIPTDVADGNEYIVKLRLNHLETYAPNMAQLPLLRETATAVYFGNQPTATLQPTQTQTPTETPQAEITATVEPTSPIEMTATPSSGYDVVALLQQARDALALGQYEEAYEILDAIIRIDPTFQQPTVEGLIFEALTKQAVVLFRSPDTLAEAIRVTDLAEQYGNIDREDLALGYERYIASLYLNAQSALSAKDFPKAIQNLNEIRQYQTTYQGQDLNRLLYNEYLNYAQAWELGSEPCQAVTYYNNALALFADNSVVSRRDNAQTLCEQGALLTPGAAGTPVAPVGQPGT